MHTFFDWLPYLLFIILLTVIVMQLRGMVRASRQHRRRSRSRSEGVGDDGVSFASGSHNGHSGGSATADVVGLGGSFDGGGAAGDWSASDAGGSTGGGDGGGGGGD